MVPCRVSTPPRMVWSGNLGFELEAIHCMEVVVCMYVRTYVRTYVCMYASTAGPPQGHRKRRRGTPTIHHAWGGGLATPSPPLPQAASPTAPPPWPPQAPGSRSAPWEAPPAPCGAARRLGSACHGPFERPSEPLGGLTAVLSRRRKSCQAARL